MNINGTYFEFMDAVMASKLNTIERMVALVIAKRYYIKGDAFPGNALIASDAGIKDVRTVIKAKKTLETAGFLSWTKRGTKKTNVYICSIPAVINISVSEPTSDASTEDVPAQSEYASHANPLSEYASGAGVDMHPVQSEYASGAECIDIPCISNREEEKRSSNREDINIKDIDITDEKKAVTSFSNFDISLFLSNPSQEDSVADAPSSSSNPSDYSSTSNQEKQRNVAIIDKEELEEIERVKRDADEKEAHRIKVEKANRESLERLLNQPWKQVEEAGIKSRDEYIMEFDDLNTELIDALSEKYTVNLVPVIEKCWAEYQAGTEKVLVAAGAPTINAQQEEWENESW